jgi:hypothetical protein
METFEVTHVYVLPVEGILLADDSCCCHFLLLLRQLPGVLTALI